MNDVRSCFFLKFSLKKNYQHLLSQYQSYFLLIDLKRFSNKFAHSKFALFVQQFDRISGYPASRISGDPANETGYPAGYRILKKTRYPVQP